MLQEYEGEIICDLAEYYHVYDYRKISPRIVLKLVEGLREDSRFVLKLTGRDYNLSQLMQAYTVDRLSILCWQKTKDGSKGRNRPKMLSELMLRKEEDSDIIGFESASDFEEYRRAIIRNRK